MFKIPLYLKMHNANALSSRIDTLFNGKFKNKTEAFHKIRVALDIPTAIFYNGQWIYPSSQRILELLEEACIIVGKPQYYEHIYSEIP
jgi:hypothetical protein